MISLRIETNVIFIRMIFQSRSRFYEFWRGFILYHRTVNKMTSGCYVTSLTEEKAASYNPRPQSESTFITSHLTLFFIFSLSSWSRKMVPVANRAQTATLEPIVMNQKLIACVKTCPEGSTTTIHGATDVSDCSGRKLSISSDLIYEHCKLASKATCILLWFSNKNILLLCFLECTEGYFKDSTTNECKKCPKGTFRNEVGATSCTSCPEGQTTSGEGKTAQSQCRNGKDGQYYTFCKATKVCTIYSE